MLFTRACCWTKGIVIEVVKLHPTTCLAVTQITGSFYLGHVGNENSSLNTNRDNFNYFVFAEAL